MNERRKDWFLGVPPAQWITIAIVAGGALVSWGAVSGQVEKNTSDIESVRTELYQELGKTEKRITEQLKGSEERTREDIKELREDIKNMMRQR